MTRSDSQPARPNIPAVPWVSADVVSPDGTRLAFHRTGEGPPLVCVPGGPMQASAYLGDLGGLPTRRGLLRLDLRGTGNSDVPSDTGTYRCDRQVGDVEALRRQLGLERMDLAAHSAGAALALLYTAKHPERVRRLVLIAPSPRAVDLAISDADRRRVAELRRDEPWFEGAYASFERIWAGDPSEADWAGITPFTYGRWDATARRQHAREDIELNADAAQRYYEQGALDAKALRRTLAGLAVPVLLIAGGYDVALPPDRAAEYAALFARAELIVLAGAGHYPWLDDADAFAAVVHSFLDADEDRGAEG